MKKIHEPTDRELIRWVGTWNTEAEVNGAGYHFGARTPVPGEVVVAHSHGKFRRGVVVSVGRTNARVALTTPSAAQDHRTGGYELNRVAGKPMPFKWVAVAAGSAEMVGGPPAPEYGPAGDVPDRSDEDHGYDTCDGTDHDCEDHPAPAPGVPEPAETAPAAPATGSSVVAILERVWEVVRANHADLPAVVIVTGSGFVGPPRWGHFRANGWAERAEKGAALDLSMGEMFVAGETLTKGAAHTVETMLHEAAHVLAGVREVKDTSRQGRWHNQRFRLLAEEVGLEYLKESAHPQAGFSECLMTPGTREEYAEVIGELDRAIRLSVALPEFLAAAPEGEQGQGGGEYIHGGRGRPGRPGTGGGAGSTTNNVKAVCGCPTPRIIRASRKVLDEGDIVCGKCREPFEDPAGKFEATDEERPWSEGGQDTSLED